MIKSMGKFVQNLKIEIAIMIIFVVIFVWRQFIPDKSVLDILSSYYTQDRLNGIATCFSIIIGVYIAVITVLATTEIGISKEMLRRKLDKPLIDVIITGIVEDFICVGLAVFIPLNDFGRYVLSMFLSIAIVSFVKFIILLVVVFRANMNQMSKVIDEEERYKDSMLTCVEEICRYCKKHIDD